MTHEVIGQIAGVIAVISQVVYTYDMFRGSTRPALSSWIIWSVLGIVAAVTYRQNPAANSSQWVPIVYAIGPTVTLAFSIRYAERHWSWLDTAVLVVVTASLIGWFISGNAVLPLTVSIMLESFGVMPTVKKAWLRPASEHRWAWTISVISSAVQLLAVQEWSWAVAGHPLYMIISNSGVATILWLRRHKASHSAP